MINNKRKLQDADHEIANYLDSKGFTKDDINSVFHNELVDQLFIVVSELIKDNKSKVTKRRVNSWR